MPGDRLADVERRLAGWDAGHRYAASSSSAAWEWSGPDGMRVEAVVSGPVVVSSRTSRTWGSGVPPVDGSGLPGILAEGPLAALFERLGPGLLVERVRVGESSGAGEPHVLDTYRWRVHDRGLDTGLFLSVHARDGRVVGVRHPWSRP